MGREKNRICSVVLGWNWTYTYVRRVLAWKGCVLM